MDSAAVPASAEGGRAMTAEGGDRKRVEVMQGDCIEVLRTLPDESVDVVITDPPYG
jgi:23S rRNA G2069 N7-methylase RlmK/C1962 C5-methylase RlmI